MEIKKIISDNLAMLSGTKDKQDTNSDVAVYSLWFGLDYGSIITAYALYKSISEIGYKPYLLQKQPELWGDHYADKENIAGKFIYSQCNVLNVFDNDADKAALDKIRNHVVGSDIVWDQKVVGEQSRHYFFLDTVADDKNKIAFGTSFGSNFSAMGNQLNEYAKHLMRFSGIAVKEENDSNLLNENFYITPEFVVDPVFLCSKQNYIECANSSAAANVETEKKFYTTYIKNGDERKRQFILNGNHVFIENNVLPIRNFIDINRYPESVKALGLDPAFHIRVEDWLYYIINSDFVVTDDYYGMCMALIFEKPFVVLATEDMADLGRYKTLLRILELEERLVYVSDDYKKKEYLFRKPVRYDKVNKILDEYRKDSLDWFIDILKNKKI